MRSVWIAALLVTWWVSASSAQARAGEKEGKVRAQDDGQPKLISVALLGGYGYAVQAPTDVNPLGIGFGVRGGYNLDALYLGARFMFFLGDSEEIAGVEISANSITLGLEAGYDIGLFGDFLVLRPELGFGLFSASIEAMTEQSGGQIPIDDSSEDVYIAPGFALLARVSERVFFGVDVQLPIIFDEEIVVEATLLATAGMRF